MDRIKKVWAIPFGLGIITLMGLLTALLGTGFWTWLAWALLVLPLLRIGYHLGHAWRKRGKRV